MSDGLAERIAFGRKLVESQIPVFDGLFGKVASEWKYDGSRVTEADLKLSKNFEEAIRGGYPGDQFFSEEQPDEVGPVEVTEGFSWMVDPIDGTNNFARGLPTCSISLALLEDGDPVYGYIYDYTLRELIHGGPAGVFVGDRKVEPQELEVSRQSIISNQGSSNPKYMKDDMALQRYFKMRCLGSSAIQIAYVALGINDGVVAHTIKSWDIAAGIAMLKGVGMDYVAFDKDPFPVAVFDPKMKGFGYAAGPKRVVEKMMELMGRG